MSQYLASYDIRSDRARTRVARVLARYGERIQKSVFEVEVEPEGLGVEGHGLLEVRHRDADMLKGDGPHVMLLVALAREQLARCAPRAPRGVAMGRGDEGGRGSFCRPGLTSTPSPGAIGLRTPCREAAT